MPPLSVDEMRRRRLVRQEKENREAGLARGHKTQFDLAREKGFVEEVYPRLPFCSTLVLPTTPRDAAED